MKTIHFAMLVALGIASAGLTAPTALADPPPWAPAHGWRAKHSYVYYPSAEVYYAPATRMWFWFGGSGWQAGISLPLALQGYVNVGGINIDLDVEQPYLRNEYVVRRYGGHQRRWWNGDDNAQGDEQGHRHRRHDHDRGHDHQHDDQQ